MKLSHNKLKLLLLAHLFSSTQIIMSVPDWKTETEQICMNFFDKGKPALLIALERKMTSNLAFGIAAISAVPGVLMMIASLKNR